MLVKQVMQDVGHAVHVGHAGMQVLQVLHVIHVIRFMKFMQVMPVINVSVKQAYETEIKVIHIGNQIIDASQVNQVN